MKRINFTKMHGIGNDYVYFTEMPCPESQLPELSRRLSDRHRSIGGDGIILVLPSDVADFRMRIFNADGSEAKMCGNGSRCVALLVHHLGLAHAQTISLETNAGIKHLTLQPDGLVSVDMGIGICSEPVMLPERVMPVDMGNPHGVVFLDHAPTDHEVLHDGPRLEKHSHWPDRANIEFAQVIDRNHIVMRVWERGSGETMACGTGACAVAVAAVAQGLADSPVAITLPGGNLNITVQPDGRVIMTGPAAIAFSGTVEI